MEQREHRVKTLPAYFEAQVAGEKPFEVRLNDRFYQRGDIFVSLEWREWPSRGFTGRELRFLIGPVLQGGRFGIEPGYCVFGLLPIEAEGGDGGA